MTTDINNQNPYRVAKREKLDFQAHFQDSVKLLSTAVRRSHSGSWIFQCRICAEGPLPRPDGVLGIRSGPWPGGHTTRRLQAVGTRPRSLAARVGTPGTICCCLKTMLCCECVSKGRRISPSGGLEMSSTATFKTKDNW